SARRRSPAPRRRRARERRRPPPLWARARSPPPDRSACRDHGARPVPVNPMPALMRFDGVSKSYGDKAALRDVSFEVQPGEVFGLLGPNGAGKTTALRILMDVVRADSGKIELFGQPHT